MNTYLAIYNKDQYTLPATTSYEAQQIAQAYYAKLYRARRLKGYDITIILLEKDGQPIVHSTGGI